MARDDGDDIRIRPGRSRRMGTRGNPSDGWTITWTSFDMPATIQQGGQTVYLSYDADHNRVQERVYNSGSSGPYKSVTYMRGGEFLAEGVNNGDLRWRSYLSMDGEMVGLNEDHYVSSGGNWILAAGGQTSRTGWAR